MSVPLLFYCNLIMKKVCDFISKWVAVLVLIAGVISMIIPNVFKAIPTTVINPLLGLIMFGMGLTISSNDFKVVLMRPKDIIVGELAQFIIMPALAWALTKIFVLPTELTIGVILVGCCPGGTASNVITYLSKGDTALSVGITTVSTIVAPFVTPALVYLLAGTMVKVDTLGMFLSIVYVVILPITAGLICQRFLPAFTTKVKDYLPAFSTLMIAFTVCIVVGHTAEKILSGGLIIIVVVILHNLCGLGLGYGIGRIVGMSRPKYIAVSIEVGMQNSGLATALAAIHFATYPLATVPGAIFSVWHNISGGIMARIYSRKTA